MSVLGEHVPAEIITIIIRIEVVFYNSQPRSHTFSPLVLHQPLKEILLLLLPHFVKENTEEGERNGDREG